MTSPCAFFNLCMTSQKVLKFSFPQRFVLFILLLHFVGSLYIDLVLQLAISPNHHPGVDHVSVEINQLLALKVEGVIQHESSRAPDSQATDRHSPSSRTTFRRVDKIKLTLKKAKQSGSKQNNSKVSLHCLNFYALSHN